MTPPQEQEEEGDFDEESLATSEETVRDCSPSRHPLIYADVSEFSGDIKGSFSAALTNFKVDILMLTEQLSASDRAGKYREKPLKDWSKLQ